MLSKTIDMQREGLIRVYRLETVMLVFSTQICELLPLLSSLWFNSPPPPCVNKQNEKHPPQSSFTGQFFR
jgi:hypothetical protein